MECIKGRFLPGSDGALFLSATPANRSQCRNISSLKKFRSVVVS